MYQKRYARIELFSLIGLIVGAISLIAGVVGIIVSVNVSRGDTYVVAELAVDVNTPFQEVKVHADKGDLDWKLENTELTTNSYKVEYKSTKNASYRQVYNQFINARSQSGWAFVESSGKTVDRFFKVTQINNLSSTTSHCRLYLQVK